VRIRPAIRNVDINVSCRDKRVGVDAAVWVLEFSIGCADEVVLRQQYGGIVARFCERGLPSFDRDLARHRVRRGPVPGQARHRRGAGEEAGSSVRPSRVSK